MTHVVESMPEPMALAEESVELVRRWVSAPAQGSGRTHRAAARLARLLQDPHGLEFTVAFVDRVLRPEDPRVAAANLRRLARNVPAFLPVHQVLLLKLGAVASPVLPGFVVANARRMMRRLVNHLVVDARPAALTDSIARLRRSGDRLNLNILGEEVLGHGEAARRRDATVALLERDDVDYVSIKVSAIAAQLSLWAFDDTVHRIVEQLRPLYDVAARRGSFVNLDMEEYHDLDLTIEVFTRSLDSFPQLEAGIALQAYLPDALGAMRELQAWAGKRVAEGGAPIKIRLVKGANLPMERVDATVHGWPLATWGSKQDTDTNYKRVLHWAFTPERITAVRVGVAGQNLFDIAYAWLLAGYRKVRDGVDFEMLLGMADGGPVTAVRATVGPLVMYTPVVHPDEFDSAISYLVRRLEENASDANFMSASFQLTDPRCFIREADRFRAAVAALDTSVPQPHRRQDRNQPSTRQEDSVFLNAADTDPSTPANRRWGASALDRAGYSQLGASTVELGQVTGPAGLQTLIRQTRQAALGWAARGAEVRAWTLRQAARSLEGRRADLVTVMAAETGKTIAEGDPEVSEAVDFARYYAMSVIALDAVDGAAFTPARLTVVTPPWNFPVAIPAGSMLAALAAGSAVIIKPAPQARRCAAVLTEALWEAGVPRDVLRLVNIEEGPLSRSLITHPDVDRVVLTGSWETAQMFRKWRPDLDLLAETSGKNALIVTPSADLDRAVADLVKSAFGHAGQKCSAASLAILVGSVGRSERFERQLIDATRSLAVGPADRPATAMGPLIEPAHGKLLAALTSLEPGESWLLEPRQLDAEGRLWSPGIRRGVRPGGAFHQTEYFGPVLGLMHAESLVEAITWQNSTDFGLTAGIHTLDVREADRWLEHVEAGNLYINRGMTGAIVGRQPFGGWKRSSVGTTAKAGGPNCLLRFGTWTRRPMSASRPSAALCAPVRQLLTALRKQVTADDFAFLHEAALSDQRAWEREFGLVKDIAGLEVERNLFRYRSTPVAVRAESDLTALGRVLLAAVRAGSDISVSAGFSVEPEITSVVYEDHQTWLRRAADNPPGRVRLADAPSTELAEAVGGSPDVAIYADEVTGAGRIELLPFLREQAISITAHRFGNRDRDFASLLDERTL